MSAERRPGEVLEDYVERQIREAQSRGEFDQIEGAGKPLPFVDKPHDPMDWWRRKLEREKLSVLPESIAVRREVEEVLASLDRLGSERLVRERLQALDARIRKLNRMATEGPPTDLAPLDVEASVARWRSRRNAPAPEGATRSRETTSPSPPPQRGRGSG